MSGLSSALERELVTAGVLQLRAQLREYMRHVHQDLVVDSTTYFLLQAVRETEEADASLALAADQAASYSQQHDVSNDNGPPAAPNRRQWVSISRLGTASTAAAASTALDKRAAPQPRRRPPASAKTVNRPPAAFSKRGAPARPIPTVVAAEEKWRRRKTLTGQLVKVNDRWRCPVPECVQLLDDLHQLGDHLHEQHDDDNIQIFECDQCDVAMTKLPALLLHEKLQHAAEQHVTAADSTAVKRTRLDATIQPSQHQSI